MPLYTITSLSIAVLSMHMLRPYQGIEAVTVVVSTHDDHFLGSRHESGIEFNGEGDVRQRSKADDRYVWMLLRETNKCERCVFRFVRSEIRWQNLDGFEYTVVYTFCAG